jgi:tetratricopeptide (TPR) repeat protein
VAVFSRDLANLYAEQERYDQSERYFAEALQLFAASYGPSHYEMKKTLTDFAAMLAAAGRPDEAEYYHRRAAAM